MLLLFLSFQFPSSRRFYFAPLTTFVISVPKALFLDSSEVELVASFPLNPNHLYAGFLVSAVWVYIFF
ncbi:hypothetical protein RchiOBHm_Chr3g0485391 [Rosa chinensis]|uniref:Uncharacterized protein n=1 Tax=Rosa chinensis TaxID=74649 RepID=A0A2P6REZ8_ROSCH|nr:hypothetical protein RchiOBHm_Chr3g0485391 [Rosa chinensis]